MYTTTIVNFFMLAAAASAAATAKAADSKALQKAAEGKCDIGNIACCNSVHDEKDEGLINLLNDGLIHNLVGTSDSPCAKTSLIDELNLLSFIKSSKEGPVCKNVIACCPGGTCVAIDGSDEKAKSKRADYDDKDKNDKDGKDDKHDKDDKHNKENKNEKDDKHDKENKHEKDDKHEKGRKEHGRY